MRSFILLELLIAIALVSGSALPFIRYPIQHLSREIETLARMELARGAEETLVDLQALHRSGKLSRKWLEQEGDELYEQKKISLTLPGDLTYLFERRITLHLERKKKIADEEFALVKAMISFHRPSKRKAVLQTETLLLFLPVED